MAVNTNKISVNEGANQIVVTASNGSQTETYTINLNVSRISGKASGGVTYDKDGNAITNSETGAFLNYSLLGFGTLISLIIISKTKKSNKFYRI